MNENITFEVYLADKHIDFTKFKLEEPSIYKSLEQEFNQMHPDSFTAQKLFLINPIRKKFHSKTMIIF